MVPLRHIFAFACGLVLMHLPSRAAVLVSEYALRGTLTDTRGGPPLTALGGKITSLGYVFAANQGLTFAHSAFTPTNYSIEMSFRLDTTAGDKKIVDFRGLTADLGLYQHNGSLNFFPTTTSTTPDITAGINVHMVMTRDSATNVVAGYINGVQRFSFVDSGALAAIPTGFSNQLNFFVDDAATSQTQAASGTLNYLRVFNGAMTSTEVSALFAAGPPAAVPEPGTFALLSIGAVTVLLTARSRKRRS